MPKWLRIVGLGLAIIAAALLVFITVNSQSDERTTMKEPTYSTDESIQYHEHRTKTSLLQTVAELDTYLQQNSLSKDSYPLAPDWHEQTVLAVQYTAPTPGYGINLAAVNEEITLSIQEPGEGCVKAQVLTPQNAFIVISKTETLPSLNFNVQQGSDCQTGI